jgi:hypothetical protein
MIKFDIPSLPGFGGIPEKRFAPEIISFAFYGRKPKIAGAVARMRIVANSNPGIVEMAPATPAPAPEVSLEEIERREQLRQAVAGNNFLAPALTEDTSHADWMAKLDMMQHEDRVAELGRIAKEEADREYPRAA